MITINDPKTHPTKIHRISEVITTSQEEAPRRVAALLEQRELFWICIVCPDSFHLYGTYFNDSRDIAEPLFENYLTKHGYREQEEAVRTLEMPNLFHGFDHE